MSQVPQHILYIRPDTFGDIVIFEPALRALMAAWPEARHTLLVRSGYETLAPLFPESVRWLATPLNPFRTSPAEGRDALATLLNGLTATPPDLIVAPTLNRTWLEVALAARFPRARRVALGDSAVDPLFARALEIELAGPTDGVFAEKVTVDHRALEWENNFRLVDHLLGSAATRQAPRLRIAPALAAQAAATLQARGLTPQGWLAVFPAGLANVPIKAWPADRFADIIAWLGREHRLPVMLLGHASEAAVLTATADAAVKAGAPRPAIWTGQDGGIGELAALLATARLYFGHDTGPMHVAAAVGTPVCAVFGGGHWPRFRPVGPQVVSVVQPLPCFGCNWDCPFGDAPCVKTLPVADVQRALTQLIAAGSQPVDAVVEARQFPADALSLIGTAAANYRDLQHDRLDRQYKIEELTHLGREKDVEIADLKTAAEERKREMEAIKAELEAECAQKDTEIGDLKAETNTKDGEIASLKHEADVKDTEIASLKKEADVKDTEIASLKHESDVKDGEIAQLKATCDEREKLIFKLTDIVKDFQRQVADLQAAAARTEATLAETTARRDALQGERDRLDAELATLRAHFAALPPDAGQYGQWLHDKDVHIRNLEAMLADARASLENHARGYGDLEHIKRYIRWLHEKELVLQQLKRACDEREALIQRLATEAAGLGRLQKVGLAAREYFRLKVWTPARTALFRRLVDDYWMQLGVLRQYEPRPLVWDPRLPRRGRLPDSRLPTVVVVTPSYNQDKFLESTILSVLNQNYPKLRYHVQDGASKDRSPEIVRRYADRLAGAVSEPDHGQADAVARGFKAQPGGPDDVLAWLNSDDLFAPRSLRFVAEYFATHPDVDVIYGHRIIIDPIDRDVGRWIMPPHDPAGLEWIDYVPQETMFFRRRAYDAVGGIDPSFQFALDWDLLARFHQARARIVRLPYFLGCFRHHSEQKTSQQIHTKGHEEMTKIRTRFHGAHHSDPQQIERYARKARLQGALTARLHALGLRF